MIFINTRPAERAKALTAFLQAKDITVLELPLLELVACELSKLEQQSVQRLGVPNGYKAVVFISETAVNYFFDYIQNQQITLNPHQTCIAVGQKTAQTLKNFWQEMTDIYPNLSTPSQFGLPENNEGLLQLPVIQALQKADKILILKGKQGRALFKTTMIHNGIDVTEVAFYQRVLPPLSQAIFQQFWQNYHGLTKPVVLITSLTAWQHWQDLVLASSQPAEQGLTKFSYLVLQSRIAKVMADRLQHKTLMTVIADLQPHTIWHALNHCPMKEIL